MYSLFVCLSPKSHRLFPTYIIPFQVAATHHPDPLHYWWMVCVARARWAKTWVCQLPLLPPMINLQRRNAQCRINYCNCTLTLLDAWAVEHVPYVILVVRTLHTSTPLCRQRDTKYQCGKPQVARLSKQAIKQADWHLLWTILHVDIHIKRKKKTSYSRQLSYLFPTYVFPLYQGPGSRYDT